MKVLGLDIEWLGHDCFRIKNSQTVFFDPYKINPRDFADILLITHEHYDHCSVQDIEKVIKSNTVIIASVQCSGALMNLKGKVHDIIYVSPGQTITVNGVDVEAVPAYNVDKFRAPGRPFHPREDRKVGYVVTLEGKRIYHAGDTDFIPEMKTLRNIDIALLPVSGTYVMTAEEAAEAASAIGPKVAVPMHYGTLVGGPRDAERFKQLAKGIEVRILG